MGSKVPQVYGPSGDEPSSRRRLPFFLLLVLAAFVAGCGYFMAGTWEDDPGNWDRAFRSTKPPDVTVVHSKYYRSPHWTYEFQYFFEIAPNTTFKTQLFARNKLRLLTGEAATRVKAEAFGDAPSWFAPKDASAYEVWIFAEEPDRKFKILIDKTSGVIFLSDDQV